MRYAQLQGKESNLHGVVSLPPAFRWKVCPAPPPPRPEGMAASFITLYGKKDKLQGKESNLHGVVSLPSAFRWKVCPAPPPPRPEGMAASFITLYGKQTRFWAFVENKVKAGAREIKILPMNGVKI